MTAPHGREDWTPSWLGGGAALRDVRHRFWRTLRHAGWSATALYLLYGATYFAFELPALAVTNLVAGAIFGLASRSIEARATSAGPLLAYFGVYAHANVATFVVGWTAGFHYYLLCLLPPIVVLGPGAMRARVLASVVLLATYVALHALSEAIAPLSALTAEIREFLWHTNVAFAFAITLALTLAFYRVDVEVRQAWLALATTDPLTGLHNRRRLLELAGRSLGPAHHAPAPVLSVAMVDIDHFKRVNDRHGHDAGDRVLREVSARLAGALRDRDTVARWGGEEFVALLTGAALPEAAAVAERLRAAVAAAPIVIGPSTRVSVTVTIGVASLLPGEELPHAISRADLAMFRGKAAGRDQVMTSAGPEELDEPPDTAAAS